MIRIEEAIARAKAQGKKVLKKELAERFWPNSTDAARQVNMTKLCTGKLQKVAPEWVRVICEVCGCSADFLFGISND